MWPAALLVLAVALVGIFAAVDASGAGDAHGNGLARPTDGSTASLSARCFGAASRATPNRCRRAGLESTVIPKPAVARHGRNAPCTRTQGSDLLNLCEFGAPVSSASAHVVLLGDSHAMNWRAAVAVVAEHEGWHATSIAMAGCPYSTSTRVIPEPLRTQCVERNRQVPEWFAAHPEVHTVFVSQISGAEWMAAPGLSQFETQVRDYIAAWSRLPASVRHIVVIRDAPKALPSTAACIERALARDEAPAGACRMARSRVLDRDAAVAAAARLHSPRVEVADLTRYFCDREWCYPVIGGALVQKDLNHLAAPFMDSLGPYLLRAVESWARGWS
jgi:hypothetical protein